MNKLNEEPDSVNLHIQIKKRAISKVSCLLSKKIFVMYMNLLIYKIKNCIKLFINYFIQIEIFFNNKRLNEEFDINYLLKKWEKNNANLYDPTPLPVCDNNVELSIIIPLYNSHNFLEKCLDALLNQETEYTYEIILINDGSTDDTSIIAEKYAIMYPDIIKVKNKTNSGISDSRNMGLKISRGKYIAFMDHDDFVDNNYVNILLDCAINRDIDVVKCQYKIISKKHRVLKTEQSNYFSIDDAAKFSLLDISGYIWGGVISRKLFIHLRFPMGFWFEDMITRLLIYSRCTSFVNLTNTCYYKVEHDSNASNTVWKNNSYKSIEHIYLLESIVENFDNFDITVNFNLFCAILYECSNILISRIKHLDIHTKQQVFLMAKKIMISITSESFLLQLNKKQRMLYNALINNHFEKWLLISKLYEF